ncbi:MAG: hypothetical protein ABI611_04310 [Solirubrobacteraceae bacterium]
MSAHGVSRPAARDQRAAALEHQRLDLVARDPEDGRDLVVRHRPELREHERGSLVVGKGGEIGEQVAQVLAPLHGARQVLGRRLVGGGERPAAPLAQQRGAAVTGDRVEPRSQLDRLVRGEQVAVGGHEGVLARVLGFIGGAEHVPAEAQDAAQMAGIEHLEGRLGAVADGRDEGFVGR